MAFARYITFLSQLEAVEELPHQMMRALKECGIEVDSRLIQEDEGWGFGFRHHGGTYRFCSRFDAVSEPLECMGWVERDTGFLASLFGPRETNCYPEIEPIIQSALAGLPTVRDVAWCSGDKKAGPSNAA